MDGPVRIVHVLQTLDSSGGGLPAAVRALAAEESRSGHLVHIMAADGYDVSVDSFGADALSQGASPGMRDDRRLFARIRGRLEAREVDVIHVHGLWNIQFPRIVKFAKRHGVPIIVSPHGQLMPALLASDSPWKRAKKRLFWWLFGEQMLSRAALVHAVGAGELQVLERLSRGVPVVCIPNFVDRRLVEVSRTQRPASWEAGERVLLFLGRVERRKGVADLVEAFVGTGPLRGWRLEIVGPIEDNALAKWVREKASQISDGGRVALTGPVFGEEKFEKFRCAHVVCLPSYSEGNSLVNIEAAMMARMVVTTPEAGIDEIADHGGVVCPNDPSVLRYRLESLSAISGDEYSRRCLELQRWAQAEFSHERIAGTWNSALSRLTGTGTAGACK